MPSGNVDGVLMGLLTQVHEQTSAKATSDLSDPKWRNKLLDLAQALHAELQAPEDVVLTQAFMLNVPMAVRTCIDLKVFKVLSEAGKPMSSAELAAVTSAEEMLLIRLLRGCVAARLVTEVDVNKYASNPRTRAMASPPLESGYGHIFDSCARPRSTNWEGPQFFRRNGYRIPRHVNAGIYQYANDIVGTPTFADWHREADFTLRFNTFQTGLRGSQPPWVGWFDVEQFFDEVPQRGGKDPVFFVDLGAGHGTDAALLARKFANVPGRIIIEDLPHVLNEIREGQLDGRIEKHAANFFEAQPIEGARLYFMRFILHDWPDAECQTILSHLRDAMIPGYSRILIQESILPDRGCPDLAAAIDLTMLAFHSGMERSEMMWKDLVAGVEGLEIVKMWHPPQGGQGIVEVVRRH